MACLTEDVILDFLEGRLDGDSRAAAEQHTDQCNSCRQLLAELVRQRTARDENPPPARQSLHRGQTIGRYMVVDRLGAGGMGVVYSAYDPELNRKVAVKLLRPGTDQGRDEYRARLLREAQAMARLSHPNVVSVFDVGTLGDEVFIAMELIEGLTLRKWLDASKRAWAEIVRTFVAAGRGLAAAHAAGLVHRDFKPDNVLVSDEGGVLVTDFGLARAQGEAEPPREAVSEIQPPLTRTGAVMGTPAYMAPEQLQGIAVDARTNQFSFCVALYEALYGVRPFAGDTTEEVLTAVREGRLDKSGTGSRVPLRVLRAIRRGLGAEPETRHPSMDALLAVLSVRSTARRWIERAAIVTAVAAVAAGLYVLQRPSACAGAEARLEGVWDTARKESVRAAFSKTGVGYAQEVITQVESTLDNYATRWAATHTQACMASQRGEQSQSMLDQRMICLERRRKELAALTRLFAEADAKTTREAISAAHKLAALDTCNDLETLAAEVPPPSDPDTRARAEEVDETVARVKALHDLGQYKEAIELTRGVREEVDALAYRPLQAQILFWEGTLELKLGNLEKASGILRDAVVAAEAAGDAWRSAQIWVALIYLEGYQRGRYDDAEEANRHAAALLERRPDEGLEARRLNNMAIVHAGRGEYEKSLEHFRGAVELEKKNKGPDDPAVAAAMDNVGIILGMLGKTREALEMNQKALAISVKAYGESHPNVAKSMINVGNRFTDLARFDEARQTLHRAVELVEKSLGTNHPETARALHNLGTAYGMDEKYVEARDLFARALAIREKTLGADHPETLSVRGNLGVMHADLGHFDEAHKHLSIALEQKQKKLGDDHPAVAHSLYGLGQLAQKEKKSEDALDFFKRAAAIFSAKLGPGTQEAANALVGVGQSLNGLGRPKEGIAPLEKALAAFTKNDRDPLDTAEAQFSLADSLWDSKRDRKRAVELLRAARQAYVEAGDKAKDDLAEADKWLVNRGQTPKSP